MSWINPTVFRDLEISMANPPYVEIPSESCDGIGGKHELDDDAVMLTFSYWIDEVKGYGERTEYVCNECYCQKLEQLAKFWRSRPGQRTEFPWDEAVQAERCDGGCYRYQCECER